jgi:O-antigen ligase
MDTGKRHSHCREIETLSNFGQPAPKLRHNSLSMIDDTRHLHLTAALTTLVLIGSVFGQTKIPVLGVGWSNILVPLGGLGLMIVHRKMLPQILQRYRVSFLLAVILGIWALIAALTGWDPARSIRWLVKVGGWFIVFVGGAAACRKPQHAWALVRTLWLCLVVLALGGVAESLAPDNPLWLVFRSEHSLSIQPRVASFLSWPNQFGLIMAAGVFFNEWLGARGIVNRWAGAFVRVLLVTQLAQSGSRNAYLVFAGTLAWSFVTRSLDRRRALAAAAAFAIAVVVLPVASLQAGLGRVWVPRLEPKLKGQTWELSNRAETFSLRSKIWREAAAEIAQNPLTGIGPDVFQVAVGPRVMHREGYNAHNLLLQITVETGVIGLALFLLSVTALVYRRTPQSVAAPSLVVMASGQFLDCFVHDPPTMVFCALLSALLLGEPPDPPGIR